MHDIRVRVLLSFALIGWAGCGGDPDDGGGDPTPPTYYQDVKPILDAKCAGCHYQGGVAPFGLTSYQEATSYAGISRIAVEAGSMPPWHANDECAEYVAVRALTEEQKTTFLEWVDTGMAEGDASAPGPALEVEATTLSRVDLTLSMEESYTPVTGAGYYDDYRCFIVPWPEADTKYISGFRALPGNDAVVHHVIAFLAQPEDAATYYDLDAADDGPGWGCFGGTGGPAQEWVGAWAPGSQGTDLPEGLGIEIRPGSLLVLQMHYNTLYAAQEGAIEPDQTSIEFKIDDQVTRPARIMPWANPSWLSGDSMSIPANEPDVMHSFAWDPTVFPFSGADSIDIYSASMHMHLLGTRARLSIERGDGTSSCLLQIDEWDFNWQDSYGFRQPQTLYNGDLLSIECHWDNTLANQPMVDGAPLPPVDVAWGESSTDEMCLGVFLIALP